MKKVLILTYYWPPSGGAGVQRWLKFVKYMRHFGWEPIVYTALDAEYPVLDHSLENDVPDGVEILRQPIREPHTWYKKFVGKKKDDRLFNVFVNEGDTGTWKQRLALYIRANYFIPDARFMWIKPSTKYLLKYLRSNQVDMMVSTGPPHSMHLIAEKIKVATGLPWLADFRDPWTTIDFADDMPFSSKALRKNQILEEKVLRSADRITVVSEFMKREFESKNANPVHVITNGFDPDDYAAAKSRTDPDTFDIVHTGSLNNRRNHPALWRALGDLHKDYPEEFAKMRIRLIGKTDRGVEEYLAKNGLSDLTEMIDYLPHEKIVEEQLRADLLLLPINRFGEEGPEFKSAKGTLTGKLFEYLAAKKPILAVGFPDSEVGRILDETRAGKVCHFDAVEDMKIFILSVARGERPVIDDVNVQRYSRKTLTKEVVAVFDEILSERHF